MRYPIYTTETGIYKSLQQNNMKVSHFLHVTITNILSDRHNRSQAVNLNEIFRNVT